MVNSCFCHTYVYGWVRGHTLVTFLLRNPIFINLSSTMYEIKIAPCDTAISSDTAVHFVTEALA